MKVELLYKTPTISAKTIFFEIRVCGAQSAPFIPTKRFCLLAKNSIGSCKGARHSLLRLFSAAIADIEDDDGGGDEDDDDEMDAEQERDYVKH